MKIALLSLPIISFRLLNDQFVGTLMPSYQELSNAYFDIVGYDI